KGAEDQLRRAQSNAYGTSFPLETKQFRDAGWYFSSDRAFDIAVAYQLFPRPDLASDPRRDYLEAILSNLNYEGGCNPVNVTYVTGLGWKRQREIVHQYAQNDRRVLPPTGIPLGNIQSGFQYLNNYGNELGALCFPQDGVAAAPYPFYDRWADTFNTRTEFAPVRVGPQWLEVEAQWPDGRRVFAVANFSATNGLPTVTVTATVARAFERGQNPGVFTFVRTGNTASSLTVTYRLGGTATKW